MSASVEQSAWVQPERSTWVQPMLVSKSATHADTVVAAAHASLLAYLAEPTNPDWEKWLSGPFTKTVRRTTPARIDAAQRAALEQGVAVVRVQVGDAVALAYPPFRRDALPREVTKAQVSGTDLPRQGGAPVSDGPFVVLVDEALTTGKACAQAAHAVWIWKLRRALDNPEQVAEWERRGAHFGVEFVDKARLVALERDRWKDRGFYFVHDAGWTEVEPNALTAAAVPKGR